MPSCKKKTSNADEGTLVDAHLEADRVQLHAMKGAHFLHQIGHDCLKLRA